MTGMSLLSEEEREAEAEEPLQTTTGPLPNELAPLHET